MTIERAAKAITEYTREERHNRLNYEEYMLGRGRAALEAIAEPTAAMIAAAQKEFSAWSFYVGVAISDSLIADMWRAMNDEMMREGISAPMSMDEKLAKLGAALQNEHRLEGEIILLKSQLDRAIEALRPFALLEIKNHFVPINNPGPWARAAEVYKELLKATMVREEANDD